jgi:hypothetical protein
MASTPDLGQSFIFNPHIIWDPIGPWLEANPGAANQIMLIRLQHQKDVLALQSKAIDQAMGVVNKAGG